MAGAAAWAAGQGEGEEEAEAGADGAQQWVYGVPLRIQETAQTWARWVCDRRNLLSTVWDNRSSCVFSVLMKDSTCRVGVVFDMQFAGLMHQKDLGKQVYLLQEPVMSLLTG